MALTCTQAVPVPIEGIGFVEVEGESLLYSHEQMVTVYLNDTAAVIWRLCDGRHTIGEIVSSLSTAYPEAASTVAEDVADTIEGFARQGVLELSSP